LLLTKQNVIRKEGLAIQNLDSKSENKFKKVLNLIFF